MNLTLRQKALALFLTPLLVDSILIIAMWLALDKTPASQSHSSLSGLNIAVFVAIGVVCNLVFGIVFVSCFDRMFGTQWRALVKDTDALVGARPTNATVNAVVSSVNKSAVSSMKNAANVSFDGVGNKDEFAHLDANVRKMAALLKEAAEKENAILGYASDVICTFDLLGKCISMNPASSRLWGYEPAELLNKDMFALIAPADRQRFGGHVNSVHHKSIPGEYELKVTRKDGTLADTLWSLYWSVEHAWIVAVVHDITARKANERLQEEFMAMVSHDLRAPLATVQMFLQGLDAGLWGELPSKLCDGGLKSMQLLDRLIALIDDILSYEKIEAGEASLEMLELPVAAVIEDAVHAVSGMAALNRVTVSAPSPTPGARFVGDHDRLVRVLTNILTNAVKYSPTEETVTIMVSEDEKEVVVQVRDRGPGVSDENKRIIFEKFKQVKGTNAKAGTGLGLAICRQIIERHGGRIGVSDAPAGAPGTIFWFKIPKRQKSG